MYDVIPVYLLDNVGQCDPGWKELPGTNKCYLFSGAKDAKSWDDSEAACMRNQGHLVDIDSVQEKVKYSL